MTDKASGSCKSPLQELEAALEEHRRALNAEAATRAATSAVTDATATPASNSSRPKPPAYESTVRAPSSLAGRMHLISNSVLPALRRGLGDLGGALASAVRKPLFRRLGMAAGSLALVAAIGFGVLWWRLSSGPIAFDLATPWLISAVEENFGGRYRIKVGGTQIERDAQGRTAVRILDVVVSDRDGKTVAVAPKAEVGIAGTSLLVARPRAASLRLVDSSMLIRIEPDGRIDFFAGGERPFASLAPDTAVPSGDRPVASPTSFSLQSFSERDAAANLAALLAWFDARGDSGPAGFDGQELTEVGIINGGLTIEDRRTSQTWSHKQIGLRLIRPRGGGVVFNAGSDRADDPWLLNAALTPGRIGNRHLQIEARQVALDDLLALRMAPSPMRFGTKVSASIQADIAANGMPQYVNGSVVAEGGSIGDSADERFRIPIGAVEFGVDWDATRGTLRMPFKLSSGATKVTLRAEFGAPRETGGNWQFAVGGGWILVDPLTPQDQQLVLRRVVVRGNIDRSRQRVTIEQGDFGTKEFGGANTTQDVTLALSGTYEYGGDNPRLTMGLAGNPMPMASFKRLWPSFVAPYVRDWVLHHMIDGTVDRIDIAADAPLASLRDDGPAIPPDGLFVDIVTSNTTLRPVDGLPAIRNADLTAKITGSTALVTMGKGLIDVSPGRRLALSDGRFEVPDSRLDAPPARVSVKAEGTVPAAAELLASERLRDFSGVPFDPGASRGAVSAQIDLELPLQADLPRGSTKYRLAVDLTNFSADRMMMGHKVEAQALKIAADNKGYQIRGDVRINSTPVQLDYRKAAGEFEAEVRLAATLDDAARARLGIDFGTALGGAVPVRLAGRVGADDISRFNVEADLTPVTVDQLLPGWAKPAGRAARVAFMATRDKNGTRFEDVLIDGPGVLAKGTVEIDAKGELRVADFPVYATSDGDKATLKAERQPDGTLQVTMRGDVYDGRSFVKSAMSGQGDLKSKPKLIDIELDIKMGAVLGHHGETLRGLELRMVRRGGRVRTFNLNARIGRDTPFIGDMRSRVSTNRQILYFETADAGALFRFTDVYPRMVGGRIWVAMDPPTQERTPQEGLINLRDFAIRGEGALDRVVQDGAARGAVEFSLARAEFTKVPGRLSVREGVVRGPIIGATIEGNIDYARDQVNMRGTLVPLYGINNMFGQIPIVGLFLGGGRDEGLLGITYEVTGPPSNPRPVVNPLSAIAPGLLRKFFEFRDTSGDARSFAQPTR